MLAIQILAAVTALTASQAFAHAHGSKLHQGRTISPFNHGNLLIKRQTDGNVDVNLGEFPEACAETCKPYIETGARCAGLGEGADPSKQVSEAEIMRCACNSEFFVATIACIQCAPGAFESGDGTTARTIVAGALGQCKCNGAEVTGIDLSSIPGKDDGTADALINVCGEIIDNPVNEASTSSGASAESRTASDKEASSTASSASGTGSIASPRGSSTGTGTATEETDTAAESASPSAGAQDTGTGRASAVAQHIPAFIVAAVGGSYLL